MLDSQERERQRIAAELHDGLARACSLSRIALSSPSAIWLIRKRPKSSWAKSPLRPHRRLRKVREIAYNLRPYQLDRFGLTKTLQAIFMKVSEASGMHSVTELDPIDGVFSKQAEISIYRMVQEGRQ